MASKLSSPLRLAAIPILLIFIAALETQHFWPSFRLASFIAVFLLLADGASLSRGKWRDLLLVLASFFFGLSVIEALANKLEQPTQPTFNASGLKGDRQILGWGPQHAGQFHSKKTDATTGATIYNVNYTIDSHLLRETHSSAAAPTIAFFGDSLTFGEGVNDAETMPQSFADLLDRKLRILNFAFSGYGPQHFLRELETGLFDPHLGSEPRLFIFMTAPWHAERTSCKASWVAPAPRYELVNDQVAFKGVCREGWRLELWKWIRNSASYRAFIEPYRTKISHDDIELYLRILLAAARLAKEKYDAPTLIPYMREPENALLGTGFSNEAIIQRLQEGGALVVDVSLENVAAGGARLSIIGDGHPTGLAHGLRASILKTYIDQHMPGVLRPGAR